MTKASIALLRALGAGQVSAQTGSVDDSAKAEGGAFAVEPLHTRVLFSVSHFGFTTYYGEFSGVSGTLDLDPKNPSASKLDIRIPVASIGTTNAELNGPGKADVVVRVSSFGERRAQESQLHAGGDFASLAHLPPDLAGSSRAGWL